MISVLIPVYNGAEFILDQLESIRTQSMPVDEVILSDDGSTDGTSAMALEYIASHSLDHWRITVTPSNLGPASNSLSLLRYASGRFVFFADQDDVWEIDKVSTMVGHLERHPTAAAVMSTESLIDDVGKDITATPVARRIPHVGSFNGWRVLGVREFFGHATPPWHAMCVRREVIELILAAGAPDAGRTLGADWYVGLIASLQGEFHQLGTPLVRRRVHSSNASLGRLRRTTLLATNVENRIQLLEEVRLVHVEVLHNPQLQHRLTDANRRDLERVVRMQEARVRFTRKPNPIAALIVLTKLPTYLWVFGGPRFAIRMLGADVLYASRLDRMRKKHA